MYSVYDIQYIESNNFCYIYPVKYRKINNCFIHWGRIDIKIYYGTADFQKDPIVKVVWFPGEDIHNRMSTNNLRGVVIKKFS